MAFQQITNQPRYSYAQGYYGRNKNLLEDIINFETIVGTENITQNDKDLLIEWYTSQGTKSVATQLKANDRLLVNQYIVKNYNLDKKRLLKFLKCTLYGDDKQWIMDWINLNPNIEFTESEKKKLTGINFINTSIDNQNLTQNLFEEFFGNEQFLKKNLGNVEIEIDDKPRGYYGSSLFYLKNIYHDLNNDSILNYLNSLSSDNNIKKKYLDKNYKINSKCIFNMYSKTTLSFITRLVYYVRILSLLDKDYDIDFNLIPSLKYMFDLPYNSNNSHKIINYNIIKILFKNQYKLKYLTTDNLISTIKSFFENSTYKISGLDYKLNNIIKLLFLWYDCNEIKPSFDDFDKLIISYNKNLVSDYLAIENFKNYYEHLIKKFNIKLNNDLMLHCVKKNCEPMFHIMKNKGFIFDDLLKYAMMNNNKNIILELINNKIIPTPNDFKYLGLVSSTETVNIIKAIHSTDLYYIDDNTVNYLKNITGDSYSINNCFNIFMNNNNENEDNIIKNYDLRSFDYLEKNDKKNIIKKIINDRNITTKLLPLIKNSINFDYSLFDIEDIINISENHIRIFLFNKMK